jgi:hypothetical protein
MIGVTDMQKRTAAQIAEVRSDVAALRDAPAPVQPAGSAVVAPAGHATAQARPADRESVAPGAPSPLKPSDQARVAVAAPPATAAPIPVTPVKSASASGPSAVAESIAPGAPSPLKSSDQARVTVAAPPAMEAPIQVTPVQPAQASGPSAVTEPAAKTAANTLPSLPEPAPVQPVSMAAMAETVSPYQAHPRNTSAEHHYRRPVRHVIYYRPGPSYALSQIVYSVRRNLYDIFH